MPHAPISHSPASSSAFIFSPTCSSNTSSASVVSAPHAASTHPLWKLSWLSVAADEPPNFTLRRLGRSTPHAPSNHAPLKIAREKPPSPAPIISTLFSIGSEANSNSLAFSSDVPFSCTTSSAGKPVNVNLP